MGFSLSPSVDIKENDISLSIPNLPSAKTGMFLCADTGYANKVIPITSENDLVTAFGTPTAANYMDWFNAWNFIQYASSLYVVRPLNATVKNAGVALTGDTQRTSESFGNFYNPDLAELALESTTAMVNDRMYFVNRYATSNQNLGIAVCSGSNYWKSPISNEFFGIATRDAVTDGTAPINLNSIGGADLAQSEIAMYGNITLKAGSQFVGNGDRLFTVKNVYNNKILVNSPVVPGDLSLYYGTVATAVDNITIADAGVFAVEFVGAKRFNLQANVVVEFTAGTGADTISILANVTSVVPSSTTVGNYTVNFKQVYTRSNVGANPPTTFSVLALDSGSHPVEIASNSEYHFFAPSTDYVTGVDGGGNPQFNVPAGTSTIKVEPGFNMPVGSNLRLTKSSGNIGPYVGVEANSFPDDLTGDSVDVYEVIANDFVNNTITVDPPFVFDFVQTTTYAIDDIVTIATAIRGINMYSTMFDSSLIVVTPLNVTDAATGASLSINQQSLVSFSKLFDYQPNWTNDEFVTVVLKKNSTGVFTIVDTKLASYNPNARDIQNRNMFADTVFFNSPNPYVYCHVNQDSSFPKVNTASMSLVRFVNDYGQLALDGASYVYGTVYPLTTVNELPVVGANGHPTYNPNSYTQADIMFAEQCFADAEQFDVNILIAHSLDINGASNIAEARRDLIAIIAPYDYSTLVGQSSTTATSNLIAAFGAQVMTPQQIFTTFGTYSSIYGNMKYQYDKFNDVNRWMCLAGDIAGLYAQTDATNDAWWAPAGLSRGKIKNVIKLAFNANKANRDELYVNSINPIISIAGEGAGIVMGQKTATQKPSAIDRVNVRRLLIVIEKAVATSVKYALFEFNDTYTRSRLIGIIDPFLRTVKSRRGVYDYLVVCDSNNNGAAILDANALVIDVYVKPTKVAEFITINMNITRSDANFQELVGQSA